MITIAIKNQNVNFGMVSLNKSLNPLFKGLKSKTDKNSMSVKIEFSIDPQISKKSDQKTTREKIEQILSESNNLAFRRDEFNQCGKYREVSRVIAALIGEGKLIRLARGFYIKSTLTDKFVKPDLTTPAPTSELNSNNLEKNQLKVFEARMQTEIIKHSKSFTFHECRMQMQGQDYYYVKPKKN
ncbi:type IV toxin-antitoxin system AbiEi family antitoxin domain-containing protein [Orrella sp. 11846]|uniref:type IV toxin-antitoxin system AbiEi family antitoxin domain-containing protein n=1 Tax=Orrella sp. 11846 TaxID=3409913 RepID=UPI003B5B2D8F